MFSFHGWKQKFSQIAGFLLLAILLGVTCFGQQPSPGGPDGPPQQGPGRPGRPGMGGPGGPGGPGEPLRLGPPGRWWDDPDFVKKLGLSDDQQKKMDETFNSSRLKLIDLFAAVQKEEALMEPHNSQTPKLRIVTAEDDFNSRLCSVLEIIVTAPTQPYDMNETCNQA